MPPGSTVLINRTKGGRAEAKCSKEWQGCMQRARGVPAETTPSWSRGPGSSGKRGFQLARKRAPTQLRQALRGGDPGPRACSPVSFHQALDTCGNTF